MAEYSAVSRSAASSATARTGLSWTLVMSRPHPYGACIRLLSVHLCMCLHAFYSACRARGSCFRLVWSRIRSIEDIGQGGAGLQVACRAGLGENEISDLILRPLQYTISSLPVGSCYRVTTYPPSILYCFRMIYLCQSS